MRRFTPLAASAALALLASCGGSSPAEQTSTTAAATTTTTVSVASWKVVAPPVVEGSTDAVVETNGTLKDGIYWASIDSVSGTGDIVFVVTQVRFGQVCEDWAATMGGTVECMNDYGVQEDPTALVSLADDADVTVASPSDYQTSYAIDVATLKGLLSGTAIVPVSGYEWTPFPFVLIVSGGVATSAHQFWVP